MLPEHIAMVNSFILHQLAVYHSNLSHDPHYSPKSFLQYWQQQTLDFLQSEEAKTALPEDLKQVIQLFPEGDQ